MLHAQRDAIHEDGMGKAEYMMSPAAGGCVCCTGWRRGGGGKGDWGTHLNGRTRRREDMERRDGREL